MAVLGSFKGGCFINKQIDLRVVLLKRKRDCSLGGEVLLLSHFIKQHLCSAGVLWWGIVRKIHFESKQSTVPSYWLFALY
jgi:hypothetical protein